MNFEIGVASLNGVDKFVNVTDKSFVPLTGSAVNLAFGFEVLLLPPPPPPVVSPPPPPPVVSPPVSPPVPPPVSPPVPPPVVSPGVSFGHSISNSLELKKVSANGLNRIASILHLPVWYAIMVCDA